MSKQSYVNEVFDSVADKYDLMNDLMSFGLHRLWKGQAIAKMRDQRPFASDSEILDLAGGTGDMAKRMIDAGAPRVTVADINENMLRKGQLSMLNRKGIYVKNIDWRVENAEELSFADHTFTHCMMSFGIRNVSDISLALGNIRRVLQPRGVFCCLEFIRPAEGSVCSKMYDLYSYKVIPQVGKALVGEGESYIYLADSIREFPATNDFIAMLHQAGFVTVKTWNVKGNVAKIYICE